MHEYAEEAIVLTVLRRAPRTSCRPVRGLVVWLAARSGPPLGPGRLLESLLGREAGPRCGRCSVLQPYERDVIRGRNPVQRPKKEERAGLPRPFRTHLRSRDYVLFRKNLSPAIPIERSLPVEPAPQGAQTKQGTAEERGRCAAVRDGVGARDHVIGASGGAPDEREGHVFKDVPSRHVNEP